VAVIHIYSLDKKKGVVSKYMLHHHGNVNVLTAPLSTGQCVYESLFIVSIDLSKSQ